LELIELKTNIRTSVGNSQAHALRRKKQIPAVLYGRGKKTVLLSVYLNELERALKKSIRLDGISFMRIFMKLT
jgi:ribosomal protein L25 (general stress protein Ctc)